MQLSVKLNYITLYKNLQKILLNNQFYSNNTFTGFYVCSIYEISLEQFLPRQIQNIQGL